MLSDHLLSLLKRGLILPRAKPGAVFSTLSYRAQRAMLIVRLFYLLNLIAAFTKTKSWQSYSDLVLLEPAWPIHWLSLGFDHKSLITGVLLNHICSAIVGFLWPHRWISRAYAFLGVFLAAGLLTSDAGGGLLLHSLYGFVFAGFFLIFLPLEGSPWRRDQIRTLSLFWLAQSSLLTIYGIAGLWRLRVFIDSIWNGSHHMFHLNGLSNMIIARTITSGEIGIIGDWVIRHPLIATLGFLFFSAVELLSIFVIFVPRAFVAWGVLLTLFHVGVLMVMNISFLDLMMVEALLLIYSPLALSRD